MRLEQPVFLLFLPFVLVFYWFIHKKYTTFLQRWEAIAPFSLWQKQRPGWNPQSFPRYLKILTAAIALICFAFVNPQLEGNKAKINQRGTDILIAVDVSNSMYARDVAPDRIGKARRMATALLESLKGNRIALEFFAGDPFVQIPLTTDYGALQIAIDQLDPQLMSSQGTDMEAALQLAELALGAETGYTRAVILISDGETHTEGAEKAAENLASHGTLLFTIGVGTQEGIALDVPDLSGSRTPKLDEQQQPVITKLEANGLVAMAKNGKGVYYELEGARETAVAQNISQTLSGYKKKKIQENVSVNYYSLYPFFLAIGMSLLFWVFLKSNPYTVHNVKKA